MNFNFFKNILNLFAVFFLLLYMLFYMFNLSFCQTYMDDGYCLASIAKLAKKSAAQAAVGASTPGRTYVVCHSGRLKTASPGVEEAKRLKEADGSGKHELAVITSCNKKGCIETNCAQPNELCESSPEQNQSNIPESGGASEFKTQVGGNFTHSIPLGREGISINKNSDYSGKCKEQKFVFEKDLPRITPANVCIGRVGTNFIQNSLNHDALLHTAAGDSKTVAERLLEENDGED